MQSDRKFPPLCWCHSTSHTLHDCNLSSYTVLKFNVLGLNYLHLQERKCQNLYPTGGGEVMFNQNISILIEIVPLCSLNKQNITSSVQHNATCFWLLQKCSIFWENIIVLIDYVLFGLSQGQNGINSIKLVLAHQGHFIIQNISTPFPQLQSVTSHRKIPQI
jgi:hypothetical protein